MARSAICRSRRSTPQTGHRTMRLFQALWGRLWLLRGWRSATTETRTLTHRNGT
ncbi:MAG: hypothetical protein GX273_10690 [Bacteroidales bacterium]|nr:hypothetical protein [Bacteroidales bacterium]